MQTLPVWTFLFNGGLNHITFTFLCLLVWFGGLSGEGLNIRLWEQPLLRNASCYGSAASLNTSSYDEMSDSLLLITSGIFNNYSTRARWI